MKKTTSANVRSSAPAYPNAASSQYKLDKAMNIITAVMSGVGFLTAMTFFFLL